MKKLTVLLLVAVFIIFAFAGCSKGGDPGQREINAKTTQPPEGQREEGGEEPNGAAPEPTVKLPDDNRSLQEFKDKAIAEGYNIVGLLDMQMGGFADMEDGFNIEIGGTYVIVLMFGNANQAKVCADLTNKGGYQVAVLTGKFLSMVDASGGVVIDLKQQEAVEKIMGAKAQTEEAKAAVAAEAGKTPLGETADEKTTDYKSAASLLSSIRSAMKILYDQSETTHNQKHPEGDSQNTEGVVVSMLNSMGMGFSAFFSENQSDLDAISQSMKSLGIMDAVAVKNAPNDYTLSGTWNGAYSIRGIYDPATGALRMVESTDGKITSFFEFVPLGGGRYACRSEYEKAYIVFADSKLVSFIYTEGKDYSPDNGSIYPSGAGVDENWAYSDGEGSYDQYIRYDGTKIILNAKPVVGSRIAVEFPAQ